MDAAQEQLIRIGLATVRDRGFALGGGNAMTLHGIGARPSEDVDIFTDRGDIDFGQVFADLRQAYEDRGYGVSVDQLSAQFGRFKVTDPSGRTIGLDAGRDYRSHPPVEIDVGPVLHPDDAVACKVQGVYDRGAAKDFIDVQAAMDAGYSRERLLELGDDRAVDGLDRNWLASQLERAQRVHDNDFAKYGISPEQSATIRTNMTNWAAEIRARQGNPDLDRNLRLAHSGVASIRSGPVTSATGEATRRQTPSTRVVTAVRRRHAETPQAQSARDLPDFLSTPVGPLL